VLFLLWQVFVVSSLAGLWPAWFLRGFVLFCPKWNGVSFDKKYAATKELSMFLFLLHGQGAQYCSHTARSRAPKMNNFMPLMPLHPFMMNNFMLLTPLNPFMTPEPFCGI
jgi:hypothetical protein